MVVFWQNARSKMWSVVQAAVQIQVLDLAAGREVIGRPSRTVLVLVVRPSADLFQEPQAVRVARLVGVRRGNRFGWSAQRKAISISTDGFRRRGGLGGEGPRRDRGRRRFVRRDQ